MGLLDGSQKLVDRALTAQVGSDAHRAVARRAVAASLVVLKNEGGTLPLAKDVPGIALGGKTGDNIGNQCGGWTVTWQGMTGAVTTGTTVRQALEAVAAGPRLLRAGRVGDRQRRHRGHRRHRRDAVLRRLRRHPDAGGRHNCVSRPSTLSLDAADAQVVMRMKQAGLKTIAVLVAGRPMIIDSIVDWADAIVVAWLPGTEGAGITDVLFGDVRPTGKLPHTWPRSEAQIPINQGDASYDPLFPYAYGMTY